MHSVSLLYFLVVVSFVGSFSTVQCKGGGGRGGGGGGRSGRGSVSSSGSGGKGGRARGGLPSGRTFHGYGGRGFVGSPYYGSYHGTMARSIRNTTNQCTDFYDFACGKWSGQPARPNSAFYQLPDDQYSALQKNIDIKVRAVLENSSDDEVDVRFYRYCLGWKLLEPRELSDLWLKITKRSWPILDRASDLSWQDIHTQLILLDVNPYFTISAEPSQSLLSIHKPPLTTQSNLGVGEIAKKVAYNFAQSSGTPFNEFTLERVVKDMLDFDREITRIREDSNNDIDKKTTLYELNHKMGWRMNDGWTQMLNRVVRKSLERVVSLVEQDSDLLTNTELNDKIERIFALSLDPKLDFVEDQRDLLSLLGENLDPIKLKFHLQCHLAKKRLNFTDADSVIVDDPDYFFRVLDLIHRTPVDVVVNHMGWKVIERYRHFFSGEIEATFRRANLKMPNWQHCTTLTKQFFPWQVATRYLKHYVSDEDKLAISKLTGDIANQFVGTLNNFDESWWIKTETLKQIIARLHGLNVQISFRGLLSTNRMPINITSKLPTFDTFQAITRRISFSKSWNLLTFNSNCIFNSIYDPFDLKIRYVQSTNTLMIPFGLLQPPFFSQSSPNFMNYAAIGWFIASELILGYKPYWWSPEHFGYSPLCFANQYRKVPPIKFQNTFSLEKLISNDRALRLLDQMWKSEMGFFDNSHDEKYLFFVQFAQMHCARNGTVQAKDRKILVNVLLQNFNEFALFFDCPEEAHMNPKTACTVWKSRNEFEFPIGYILLVGGIVIGLLFIFFRWRRRNSE